MAIGSNDGGIVGGGGVGASPVLDRSPVAATGTESVNPSVKPLSNLGDVVAAAKQEAEVAVKSPTTQFTEQFGSGVTPSVAETPVLTDVKQPLVEVPADASVAPLDPGIKTIDDLLKEGPRVVEGPTSTAEAAPQTERTPQDKFKQTVSDAVNTLLEEVAA